MCEHKNLKTVNDQLFCKDCGQNLPMDFLIKPVQEEPENLEAEETLEDKLAEQITEEVQPEEPEVVFDDCTNALHETAEAETPVEEPVEATAEPEEVTEAPQEDTEQVQNTPDDAQTGKSAPVKKERKTTRKTAKKGE